MAAEVSETPQAIRMSWEDFLALDDKGEYYDGYYLPPDPMTTRRHQRIIVRLQRLLEEAGAGQVVHEWGWRPTLAKRKYSPDLMVIDDRYGVELDEMDLEQYWDGPVLLLVEVLSESNKQKDLERNVRDYAQFGCPEYWIIDQYEKTITVHLLRGGEYRSMGAQIALVRPGWPPFVVASDLM
jgi:Uma2 family endonuclease